MTCIIINTAVRISNFTHPWTATPHHIPEDKSWLHLQPRNSDFEWHNWATLQTEDSYFSRCAVRRAEVNTRHQQQRVRLVELWELRVLPAECLHVMIVLDSGRIAGVPHLQHVSMEMTISASRGAFFSWNTNTVISHCSKLPEHSHLLSRLQTSVHCEQSWHEEPDVNVPSGPQSGWQVCGKRVACIQPTTMSCLRDWNNTRPWDVRFPQHCCWGLRYFGLLWSVAGLLTTNGLSSSSRLSTFEDADSTFLWNVELITCY